MTDKSVICAISTAPGMGAIALLRLSGEGAIELTDQIFKSITGKKLSSSSPNRVYYGEIYADDEVL
ncbi:tRNA uridine-5-carboxymethylaminomethyl(34) synthesis GTPase MnmE, partial [Odoribacter sp. OttesenSCG-928-A06]|nr:tRNA uridine-5-carboxymethylaminomethyl(34) synthesis GTPase MnmE [Odoribacter sp. OttesenSCG-928-A06]